MANISKLTWKSAAAGRWVARIIGTLMVLFLLSFLIGEGAPPIGRMHPREQQFALALGALYLGLAIAWFWEGWGGLLSVLGWAGLGVLMNRPAWGLQFTIPAATGMLHILCWIRLRGRRPELAPLSPAATARRRIFAAAVAALVAVFVLLSADEIFGNPPLLARSGPPPAELAGIWPSDSGAVSLVIDADGTVTGMIAGVQVTHGALTSGRSWFGRMMHWGTDYVIRGSLAQVAELPGQTAGDRFTVALVRSGPDLAGSLFLSHPGAPRPVRLRLRKR